MNRVHCRADTINRAPTGVNIIYSSILLALSVDRCTTTTTSVYPVQVSQEGGCTSAVTELSPAGTTFFAPRSPGVVFPNLGGWPAVFCTPASDSYKLQTALRYVTPGIPHGATITGAYTTFATQGVSFNGTVCVQDTAGFTIVLHGQKATNATVLTNSVRDISSRTLTNAFARGQGSTFAETMYSVGTRSVNTVTFSGGGADELDSVIQELVNLPDWTTDSDIVLVMSQADESIAWQQFSSNVGLTVSWEPTVSPSAPTMPPSPTMSPTPSPTTAPVVCGVAIDLNFKSALNAQLRVYNKMRVQHFPTFLRLTGAICICAERAPRRFDTHAMEKFVSGSRRNRNTGCNHMESAFFIAINRI
eukprot:m.600941 g.600941  ORF g.600941 m.600941 type:complete len:361 (-) comp22436_c0_seq12:584-1666(-)